MEINSAVSGLEINGVEYSYSPQGCLSAFKAYLQQEMDGLAYQNYVIAYAEWLKGEKPELFSTHKSVLTATISTPAIPDVTPRTQKAKGIKFISGLSSGFSTVPFELLVGTDRDKDAVKRFMGKYSPVFARPCPETPRHGFVDSRKVDSIDGVFKLYQEVKDVDPNGEMVIMRPVDAKMNCVITENSITVGAGHDGATTGTNAQVFPIFGTWKESFGDISAAGIAEGDVPYLETVTEKGRHYLVQMRGGPAITSRAVDYVPHDIVVTRVIKAQGDLLAWETTMKDIAGESGVVVDHTGGALTSHYGVHAILNKIPVLTSKTPVVGEFLSVVDDTVTHDYMAVVTGMLNSLNEPYSEKKAAQRVTAMVYATQYFSALGGENSYFIGHAIGTMLNYGIAACGGEYRHHPNNPFKSKYTRNRIYSKASRNFIAARKKLGKWAMSFAIDDWPGSFGGPKWYDCADAIIQLDVAARAFLRAPNTQTFNDMLMAQNRAINCAHNGGWWFNKFVEVSVFNNINTEHLPTILDAVAYMFNATRPKLDLSTLDLYQKYSNGKVIKVDIIKTATAIEPEFAQARILSNKVSEGAALNIESLDNNNRVRLQIKWQEQAAYDETTYVAEGKLADIWDFNVSEYSKSLASALVAYVPLLWEKVDDFWVFRLESNGNVLCKVPVKYEYTTTKA